MFFFEKPTYLGDYISETKWFAINKLFCVKKKLSHKQWVIKDENKENNFFYRFFSHWKQSSKTVPCQGKNDKYINENLQYMYFNDEHGIFMKSYKLIRLERTVVCNLN